MAHVMKDLESVGINSFAVLLVAESLLKSILAPTTVNKPLGFFFPVNRSDCEGWDGVRLTLEAVRPGCGCREGECETKADRECRMVREVREAEAKQKRAAPTLDERTA